MTRYFMTIPEAAQLTIQAGAMGKGGEVFVLDMGDPVRIIELAHRMIELSGLSVRSKANVHGDIEISVIGMRPGEKLYEELLIGNNPLPTNHKRIMKANEKFIPWAELKKGLDELERALEGNDVVEIRRLLQELVYGYVPDEEIVDWVHLENCLNKSQVKSVA
jgi:FlaA1/EpsC-like NDP-sugar epimerase